MIRKAPIILLVLLLTLVSCATPTETVSPTITTETIIDAPVTTEPSSELEAEPTLPPTEEPQPEPPTEFESTFEVGPCPFNVPSDAYVECGHVVVPEDHSQPDGASIRLAVVVINDLSEDHQPDPVILLTGGPGEKAVENGVLLGYLFQHVHPNRDLIIFDQRGVGLSEPALECPDWVQAQYEILDEADPFVSGEITFDALLACRDDLLDEGYNLSAYNTTQSAHDVNAIRTALGYEELNVFGGSYGSFLAQEVVRQHQDVVRSLVINSVWPLEVNFLVNAPLVTTNAVLDMLAACEADPDCSQAYPNLEDVFSEVVETLNDEPEMISVTHAVSGEQYDVLLTGDRVFSTLVGLLYQTQLIPMLPQAIYNVSNQDYALIGQLLGVHLSLYEALSRGMEFSVLCAEDVIGVDVSDQLDAIAQLPDEYQGDDDEELIRKFGIFAICEEWPVELADPSFKEPLVSDIPALLLEGEFDPVTPTEFAEIAAKNLSNSYLFEFPGVGHNITAATDCSRQMIGAFIDDPSQAPSATCVDDLSTGFNLLYEDPAGLYTVPLQPGWTLDESASYPVMTSPDGGIAASLVVVEADNFTDASDAAWEIIDPDFDSQLTVSERPCRTCAADDADAFALLTYETGDESEFILAAAWLHDGKAYVIIYETDPATLETDGALIDMMIIGFSIAALDEPASEE